MVDKLSRVTHYPLGGKELTEVLRGLLGKYRSMVLELQHDLFLSSQSNNTLKNSIDIIKSKNEEEKNEILMKIKYDAQAQNEKEKENLKRLKNGDRKSVV